jgi:hypothetical protein
MPCTGSPQSSPMAKMTRMTRFFLGQPPDQLPLWTTADHAGLQPGLGRLAHRAEP